MVFLDGQFKSATGGHFQLAEGGQFHWNFHYIGMYCVTSLHIIFFLKIIQMSIYM